MPCASCSQRRAAIAGAVRALATGAGTVALRTRTLGIGAVEAMAKRMAQAAQQSDASSKR